MVIEPIVFIIFVILLVLLLLNVQVGVIMGLLGTIGLVLLRGWHAFAILPFIVAFVKTTYYPFLVIPLFILMGEIASRRGFTEKFYDAAYKWLGRLAGGLAIATSFSCALFAAICGSSLATVIAMSKVALPEMRRFGYQEELSLGIVCCAATFAIMIPPSTIMVLYAIIGEVSIGLCLLAGFVPGVITAICYSLLILIRSSVNPTIAPKGERFSWRERMSSLQSIIPFMLTLLGILGGILLGIWTPTEAAAVGVILVFATSFLLKGVKERSRLVASIKGAFQETVLISATLMIIIIGAGVFSRVLVIGGFIEWLGAVIEGFVLPPKVLLMILLLIYVILGTFMEAASQLAITIPIFLPIITKLGFSPVWFAVFVVKAIEVGCVTPPFGLNIFGLKSAAPTVPIGKIYKGAIPFWLVDIALLMLFIAFPEIILWLPNMAVGAK